MSKKSFDDWGFQDYEYGGLFGREIDHGIYHVIEFTNWENATGELSADGQRYYVELSMVDVLFVDPRTLVRSLESYGASVFDDVEPRSRMSICAEAIYSYGCHGRLGTWSGNNGDVLLRSARRVSKELENDPGSVDDALAQQANQMGNSWRDFMMGKVGFSPGSASVKREPGSLVKDYALILERRLLEKEAEIRELQAKLTGIERDSTCATRALCS